MLHILWFRRLAYRYAYMNTWTVHSACMTCALVIVHMLCACRASELLSTVLRPADAFGKVGGCLCMHHACYCVFTRSLSLSLETYMCIVCVYMYEYSHIIQTHTHMPHMPYISISLSLYIYIYIIYIYIDRCIHIQYNHTYVHILHIDIGLISSP